MLKPLHKNVKNKLNHMLKLTYGLTLFRLIFITWGGHFLPPRKKLTDSNTFSPPPQKKIPGFFLLKPGKF
jgi:hypothetical protein